MKKTLLTAGALMLIAGTAIAQPPKTTDKPAEKPAAAQPKPADKAPEADTKTLMVGDPAPALHIEKWVKGEPVTSFEKGKVYVLDFWATWCGPCKASMPHLTEMQKEYKAKGVTVIGVTSKDARNTLDAVEKMVADKGDEGMGYTIAWDTGRDTDKAYMKAADQHGIPCAFIINGDGKVAFIGVGYPMEGFDEALEQIVAGKYDLKAAAAKYKTERENEGKVQDVSKKIGQAMGQEDWPAAIKAMDELAKLKPSAAPMIASQKFMIMLTKQEEPAKAYAFAREAIDGPAKDNAQALNSIAWMIVDPEGSVKKPDLDVALKAAQRADELTKNKDGAILDTLARVYWLKGDKAKAIETQTKAVAVAPEQMKGEIQDRLDEYKKDAGKN